MVQIPLGGQSQGIMDQTVGGLAMLGSYSDEEDVGDGLTDYLREQKGKKSNGIVAYGNGEDFSDSESSSSEAEETEPNEPSALVLVDYADDDYVSDKDEEENDSALSPSSVVSLPSSELLKVDSPSAPSDASMLLQNQVVPSHPPPHLIEDQNSRKHKREENLDEYFSMLPPAKKSCSKPLREKVRKFLKLKDQGQSINGKISKMKDLRNPYILEHLLTRHDLDELGSNYPAGQFDPHGFDSGEFHEALQTAQYERMKPQGGQKGIIEFTSNSKAEPSNIPGTTAEGQGGGPRRNSSRWDVGGQLAGVGTQPNSFSSLSSSISSKPNRKI